MDDVILLYSKYPLFQLADSELENYPIVIEIETEDYSEGKFSLVKSKDGVDVYSCSDTVYLNPFHCRVYFGSYAERQGVLTKAEQSLENKFSKLYTGCFLIKQTVAKGLLGKARDFFSSHENETEFKWDSSYRPSDIPAASIGRVEYDALVDHVKGFLYCYLIGANSTVSQDVAELQSVARNLRNILAAAFNSPNHCPTEAQDASLLKNIEAFNKIFCKTDEVAISNQQKIDNSLSKNPQGFSIEQCVGFLKYANVYSEFCAKLRLSPTFDANELWSCFEDKSTETFNRVIDRMRIAVSRVVGNEHSKSSKRSITDLVEVSHDHTVMIKDLPHKDFYEKLVQSQIKGEYKKVIENNGVEASLAIAYNGGSILKSIMGNKWEGSAVNTYIASLLNHFQESTPFDLFAINNEVPISFAAFCQKGDSIDRLLDYMEQCGISNAKFALGLYGATYGFASLPKTFTSQLINDDKEYYKSVYLAIHRNLFGIELPNAVFPRIENSNNNVVIPSSIGSKLINNIDEIESKPSKQSHIVNAIAETARLEDAVQNPKAFMYIADNILGKRSNAYKALKEADFENDTNTYTSEEFHKRVMDIIRPKLPQSKKSRQEILAKVEQIIALEAKRQNTTAFLYILDDLIKPTEAAYKNIVKWVNKSIVNQDNSIPALSHVDTTMPKKSIVQSGVILQDKKWIEETSRLIADEKSKKQYITDIRWFIDNHYSKSGYYSDKSKDNISVVNRLEKYLKRKQEPNQKALWLADIYKKVPVDDIIEFVKKKFNV